MRKNNSKLNFTKNHWTSWFFRKRLKISKCSIPLGWLGKCSKSKVKPLSYFWANLETFLQISPNQEFFFKNPALWLFYLCSPLTSCKKIRKIPGAISKKIELPTNQPINYQQHWFYRTWLMPVQQNKVLNDIVLDEFCV